MQTCIQARSCPICFLQIFPVYINGTRIAVHKRAGVLLVLGSLHCSCFLLGCIVLWHGRCRDNARERWFRELSGVESEVGPAGERHSHGQRLAGGSKFAATLKGCNIQSPSPVFMPMDKKNIVAPRHVELRVESCAHNPSTKTKATGAGPRF